MKKRKKEAKRRKTAIGSWRTAQTEAEAARRHLAQATLALDRLAAELATLRDSADRAARLDLSRALATGPDGGPLTLIRKLAESPDPAAAPIAAVARLAADRLVAVLGPQALVLR